MSNIRTDLALEAHEIIIGQGETARGITCRETEESGLRLTEVRIENEEGERAASKKRGLYLTLETGRPWTDMPDDFKMKTIALRNMIRKITGNKEHNSVLVIGLGNRTVTADAIGPYTINKLIVTRHLKCTDNNLFEGLGLCDLAALSPGVLGQTGIESADIIKSVVDKIRPSVLIVVDSLAGRKLSRLATTVQLSDSGISPGSGVGNQRHEISPETMGIPVISIGVPTVVDAATLAYDAAKNAIGGSDLSFDSIKETLSGDDLNFFVTPKETDLIMSSLASMIGYAINLAFNESLSYEEMLSLVG